MVTFWEPGIFRPPTCTTHINSDPTIMEPALLSCSWVVHETFSLAGFPGTHTSTDSLCLSATLLLQEKGSLPLKMKLNSQILSNRISYFPVTHLLIAIQFLVELLRKFVFSFTPLLLWFWDTSGKHPFTCVPTEFHLISLGMRLQNLSWNVANLKC